MGIDCAPSALFFLVCLVLLWLLFRLSLQVAEQRSQIQRLAQELAVLTAQREPPVPPEGTASEDAGPPAR
ncbi:hypothetical protein SAMN05443639_102704 [Stigmatella erecta]|uniref:Uncharacterized protein n=1 Tax=Stigmatella erecta TaxID=83460 RepID=A0A1I0DVI3_9BACT|nr:hypothetical protein SAMN05443639_102704 [Stigmatella erecta]